MLVKKIKKKKKIVFKPIVTMTTSSRAGPPGQMQTIPVCKQFPLALGLGVVGKLGIPTGSQAMRAHAMRARARKLVGKLGYWNQIA